MLIMDAAEADITRIAERLKQAFPSVGSKGRTIGREVELPVIDANGRPSDVSRILDHLEKAGATPIFKDGYRGAVQAFGGTVSAEAGLATIEFSSAPAASLDDLQRHISDALVALSDTLAANGVDAYGLGIHPFSGTQSTPSTPKPHYGWLREAIGPQWDWFSVTCGDHVHISVAQGEVLRVRDALDLSVPLFQALFSNSVLHDRRLGEICNLREWAMRDLHAEISRTGPFLRPVSSFEELVAIRASERFYLSKDASRSPAAYKVEHGSFGTWLSKNAALSDQAKYESYLFHDHYTWNCVRLRPDYGTVEMRIGCAQPFGEMEAYPALILGISEKSGDVVEAILDRLPTLAARRAWSRDTLRHPDAQSANCVELGAELISLARSGLRSRKLGEERVLDGLMERLFQRRNPSTDFSKRNKTIAIEACVAERSLRHYAMTQKHLPI